MFLHKSIAIQINSLYLLYTGYLAGFPAILDIFTDVANTTSIPIGWEGGGMLGATKWWAKATSSLKTAKRLPFVPFSPPQVTQNSYIHSQTHQPVVW